MKIVLKIAIPALVFAVLVIYVNEMISTTLYVLITLPLIFVQYIIDVIKKKRLNKRNQR